MFNISIFREWTDIVQVVRCANLITFPSVVSGNREFVLVGREWAVSGKEDCCVGMR